MNFNIVLLCVVVISCFVYGTKEIPPHIVFIMADDMGWDDVSFHGSNQIITPNIDLLAYSGIALGRYYSHCVCTPSRAALLTGKYAYKTGMQGYPLTNSEDRGLPVSEKLLPEYLKELGYSTHLIGKWHLGQSRSKYLPTLRGFDTHLATEADMWITMNIHMRRPGSLGWYQVWDCLGIIASPGTPRAMLRTFILRKPNQRHDVETPLFLMVAHNAPHSANEGALLQAPPEDVRAMRHVESPARRIYAAMMKKLDESVGDILEALLHKGILEKTIVVFISDNGGMTSGKSLNYASNWPLRGLKFSPYEGGVRVAGLVWNPNYWGSNHLWDGYMHVVDWLPTLLRAVGSEPPLGIDGMDLWDNIHFNRKSSRQEIFEIDDYHGFAAYTSGDYKLIISNDTVLYGNHQGGDMRGTLGKGPLYQDSLEKSKMYKVLSEINRPYVINATDLRNIIKINCNLIDRRTNICHPEKGKACLFNIKMDPCENEDLSLSFPELVDSMRNRLEEEISKIISRIPLYRDPRSAPKLHNFTWNVWADDIK